MITERMMHSAAAAGQRRRRSKRECGCPLDQCTFSVLDCH